MGKTDISKTEPGKDEQEKADNMVESLLPAGTVVKINGLPFMLMAATVVSSALGNFALAGIPIVELPVLAPVKPEVAYTAYKGV